MQDARTEPRPSEHFDALVHELRRQQDGQATRANFAKNLAEMAAWSASASFTKAKADLADMVAQSRPAPTAAAPMANHDAVASIARRCRRAIDTALSIGTMSRQEAARRHKQVDALALRQHQLIALARGGSMQKAVVADWSLLPAADPLLRKAIMPEDREADARIIETGRQAMQRKKSDKAGLSDWSSIEPAERRAA